MDMKNYIFITSEGYTFSPNSTGSDPDIDNCQVLGFVEAKSSSEAFMQLKEDFSSLSELGFCEVLCYELKNNGVSENFTL